jgi:hypothetical protein
MKALNTAQNSVILEQFAALPLGALLAATYRNNSKYDTFGLVYILYKRLKIQVLKL